ncbi:MAG: hypothetical protein M3P18_02235, partial [Actinomycetota bacterium]|nr:hypothetical protein [Actinomycetota bacterium]
MDGSESFDFPAPPGGFLKYPKHKVIGLVDDSDSVRQAMDELVIEGFAEDDVSVLSGPEGAERLDVDGRYHGLIARIYRLFERLNDSSDWLQRHSDHIARGGFGVSVSADRDSKAEAAVILLKHGAHEIAYFDS